MANIVKTSCLITVLMLMFANWATAMELDAQKMRYVMYGALATIGYCVNKAWTTPDTSVPKIDELDVFTLKLQNQPCTGQVKDIRTLYNEVNTNQAPDESCINVSNKSTLHEYALAKKGLQVNNEDKLIMILAQGGNPSNAPKGLLTANILLKNAIIPEHAVCVSHSSKDYRRKFAFGSGSDSIPLSLLQQECDKYKQEKVHIGECIGGYKILKLATENPDSVNTIVLLSPYISTKKFIDGLGNLYVAPYFGKFACKLLHPLMKWYFPNYSESLDTVESNLKNITNKKILFIHHENDAMIPLADVKHLIDKLKDNNECYLHVCKNIDVPRKRHGAALVELQECKEVINAFYEKNNLPCFAELAQNGRQLLEQAQLTK